MDQFLETEHISDDAPAEIASVLAISSSYFEDEVEINRDSQFGNNPVRNRIFKQQQVQQETRLRIRQQKLRYTIIGYIIVMVFLAILQFIGVGIFTLGFLLSRPVLPNIAECNDTCLPAAYDKTILLVIDALRFDFAIPVEGSNEYYHNNFPILHRLAESSNNAVLLKFMADPPTTTLQRLKGLTTGSLPTFIDAGSNFDGDAIDEDNWLLQLHKNNKSIAFMGDDTWTAMFDEYINPDLRFPYDSLNVWDLHTVDNGVTQHLFPLLEAKNSSKWDLLVGHFLGVDHVGHRYGPNHYSMKEKLNQMDKVIEDVINKMDDKTLLVIIGDHGMDSTGNHGGDAPDELESTLFMYSKSKKKVFNKKSASHYDASNLGKEYRRVNQIDLVPTISLLMGLPVPYNNLGMPIYEGFATEKDLRAANLHTINQLQQYRDQIPNLSSEINSKHSGIVSRFNEPSFITESQEFQAESLEEFKNMWARFDLKMISIGIAVLFAALTFILTYSRSIPSIRVLTMSFEFINSVTPMLLLGIVLSVSIYFVLKPADFNLKMSIAIGTAIGITVGFWAPIMDRFSLSWLVHQIHDFFVYNFNSWSFLALVFVVAHCMIFTSNSYVVWEDKMVLFFIITFGVCCIYSCLINTRITKEQKILGILHAITFTILARLTSMIQLCREEQRPYCKATFATTGWSICVLHICTFALPAFIKAFYKLSDSYHSAAPLWIGTALKFLLFMNASYWTLEFVQNSEYFLASSLAVSSPLIKSFMLAIARIVMVFSLIIANYCWSRGPLCLKLQVQPTDENAAVAPQKTATILGCANAYGSSYFLLVINFAVAVLLVNKPMGAISLNMLIVQILSLLELFDLLDIRKNLIAPVIFGLLAFQHFFSTGHQATIQSIQWDAGFITTELIVFPFTHINIVLNTFGSFLIVCLSLPLITLWKIPPSSKPITVLAQIVTDMTTFLTYQLFTGISSLIFAAHFRRHLMVWKIFAPRFMLSGILIVFINLVLILFTLWFGSSKIVTQINRIFK